MCDDVYIGGVPMIQIARLLFLLCLIMLSVRPAVAEDDAVSIVGGAAFSFKNEEFELGSRPFQTEFATVELSVIAAFRSTYIKLSYDRSINDDTSLDTSINYEGNQSIASITMGREETSLTIGYNFTENLALLGGYTNGETSFYSANDHVMNVPGPGFLTSTGVITEKGPFLGVSYSHYLKDQASLSFTVAYADLDGEVASTVITTALATGVRKINSVVVQGDATGFSYAATWTDSFSESSLLHITLKLTRYEFDAPPQATGPDFDFDDNYDTLSIGFTRFF